MGALDGVTDQFSGFSFGSVTSIFLYVILALILFAMLSVVGYFVIMKMKYNKKVVVWAKVGGQFTPRVKTRGRFLKFGKANAELFHIRKLKKHVPAPTLQAGPNTYFFFQRKDGELINFMPEDFDEKTKQMSIHFVDQDMRYAVGSLEDYFNARYDEKKFWDKYGQMIISIIAITIILVFVFLILDKYLESIGQINDMLKRSAEVAELNKQVIAALDNACSGSGLVAQ